MGRRTIRRFVVKATLEQMFLGQYQHSLDNKGRLTIPSRFRDVLSDGAYISKGFDRNLMLIKPEDFNTIYSRVNQFSMTEEKTRQLRRLIYATADKVEVDRVGRILIPQFLRDICELNNEVVLVGVGEVIELWSPEAWEEQIGLLKDAEANAQRFETFDLSITSSNQVD